ncbi:MAG: FAD-dependent oxidoreductase [Sulfurovum sp.]|nr:FAD-binding oxidoreductase [Sulfurovum sp.]NNJ45545.1 FAD-dependent oxidoreductase [Sulfurovum sp.]
MPRRKIAIVGAGVAGATTALYLGQLGLDVTLFEKKESISSGPPYCHLHAGGNLYREISDEQCVTLLRQSIDFAKFYPFIVDYRPTVIVLPKNDKSTPDSLLPRLQLLQKEYQQLIEEDDSNEVLGKSDDYYKFYHKEDVEKLLKKSLVNKPISHDEWVVSAIKHIDLENVQYPLVLVQEYGMNLFRFGAGAELALGQMDNVKFFNNTSVQEIEENKKQWNVAYKQNDTIMKEKFDYLINASGFRTGSIDDMLGVKSEKMVEFKASYISQWEQKSEVIFPEIIFHGERGTPQGMAQFTPYPGGYFQLHGMTNEITLYEDGLVASTDTSAQPRLKNHFIQKLDNGWNKHEMKQRTEQAIKHLEQFIPAFIEAKVGAFPLFGAQQIPGDDPTLRVAEVSFPKEHYARCEIVKVSSSLDMVDTIESELVGLGYVDDAVLHSRDIEYLNNLDEESLSKHAQELALSRGYPVDLANINVPRH